MFVVASFMYVAKQLEGQRNVVVPSIRHLLMSISQRSTCSYAMLVLAHRGFRNRLVALIIDLKDQVLTGVHVHALSNRGPMIHEHTCCVFIAEACPNDSEIVTKATSASGTTSKQCN